MARPTDDEINDILAQAMGCYQCLAEFEHEQCDLLLYTPFYRIMASLSIRIRRLIVRHGIDEPWHSWD